MTLASLNIKATAEQIINVVRETYAERVEENCKKVSDLDIDEACVPETQESFAVVNGIITWHDEDGEKYNLEGILGCTAGELADEAYCDADFSDNEIMGWGEFYAMTYCG